MTASPLVEIVRPDEVGGPLRWTLRCYNGRSGSRTVGCAVHRAPPGGVHIHDFILHLYTPRMIPRHLAATLRRTAGGFRAWRHWL